VPPGAALLRAAAPCCARGAARVAHPTNPRPCLFPGRLQEQQAQQPAEDLPPWVRREKERELEAASKELPWPLYLVASCIVAIAAVGRDSLCTWCRTAPGLGA
jgi:hypothetical protein